MGDDIVTPRYAPTRRYQPPPSISSDIETVFWNAGYHVTVARLSSKRYRVTFLGNPWKHRSVDDMFDVVGERMDQNLSKWHYWKLENDLVVPDSWLLKAP
jgi:hypothetical protein